MADLREQATERVGRILQGKWRLDELIGVGGTASVYAATHRNHKRVAVKMLHREVSQNAEVRERFLREGYVANTVGHVGAVSVLDDDVSEEGLAFLVMELLEGQTLESLSGDGEKKLEPLLVLGWIDALLEVLTAAHDKGIVHRDLKPENIFLTKEGQLKVLDFGIARAFESVQGEGITKTGFVMGTPAFMAPEQAMAHWDEVDVRTDLWAVGATMFTLLSARHVHEGKNGQEVMIRAATSVPTSLAKVVPGIPSAVAAVVDRAVAFERADRWSDAKTMRLAVKEAIASLTAGPTAAAASPAIGAAAGSAVASRPASQAAASVAGEASLAGGDEDPAVLDAALASARATYASARGRLDSLEAELASARAERASLEQRMNRQVGTRAAGVDEAQVTLRRALADLGRRALGDAQSFGPEIATSRAAIDALVRTAGERERDVHLHEAALASFDRAALHKGYAVAGSVAFLLLAILFGPLVYRSYVGVEAPPLHGTDSP
jgi:tRNA A-37 threonylcarbamoyl transferase component Bud32